jgi:hypothetical protein
MSTVIFVFGSNLAGRHKKGAALHALKHCGAITGKGQGIQGDSYAIPTMDARLKPLPLTTIKGYVDDFLAFANEWPDMNFWVTPIGCGLAGYRPVQIAWMFADAPENCHIPTEFKELNDNGYRRRDESHQER